MLPMHLRHGRWYCLFCSDIEQKWRATLLIQVFVGMLAVELCDGSSCQRRMFSFV